MLHIETALEIIAKELEKLEIPEKPEKLYEPVRYTLSNGGKRLRPALVLLACDLFGADFRKALYPAIGIEVFHNFTLLHDDLMDDSVVRRNMPTVHVKWDANTAILSGDAMSILANSLIIKAETENTIAISRLFNKTALEVCEGQMLDMEYAGKTDVTIPQYLNMIGLKTSVLIAASLAIGALVAGATEKQSETLYHFGMNLGLAFQLQDDLLDSFGDQVTFGKKIGNDIINNKRTFLVIKALEKARDKDFEDLNYYFSGKEFDPEAKIKAVLVIFNKLNIRKDTEEQIRIHHQKALNYLAELNVPQENKKVLIQFSDELMKREK